MRIENSSGVRIRGFLLRFELPSIRTRDRITVRGQVLPQHGAVEDPVHVPFDMTSRFTGQWTFAFFVQDRFEPVANGQRFYLS
jgi:hypothetical protein